MLWRSDSARSDSSLIPRPVTPDHPSSAPRQRSRGMRSAPDDRGSAFPRFALSAPHLRRAALDQWRLVVGSAVRIRGALTSNDGELAHGWAL
jgi:hypothetical protein